MVSLAGCAGAANATERASGVAEDSLGGNDDTIKDALALKLDQIQNPAVRDDAEDLQQAAQRAVDAKANKRTTPLTNQISDQAVSTEAIGLFTVCSEQGVIRRPE